MASDTKSVSSDTKSSRSNKSFPTILSKMKTMSGISDSIDRRSRNSNKGRSRNSSTEDTEVLGSEDDYGLRTEDGRRRRQEDGRGSRMEPPGAPKLAWGARRDSNISTLSSLANGDQPGGRGFLTRISSVASLSGKSPWAQKARRKRDAEVEYQAQKVARQKEEMMAFYRGTPMTDDQATSSEIIRFLYDMWEPQLCPNYRKDAKITSTCRQDLRNAKKIVQSIPRRQAKLHRARLVIDVAQRFGGVSFPVSKFSSTSSRPDSARSSVMSRPVSAKSIT